MRRLVLSLAVLAMLALTAGTATADYRGRGHYGPREHAYHSSHRHYGYGGYGYRHRSDPFGDVARQIRAAHSRYRFNTHPRSFFNSPPSWYDSRRW